MAIFVHFLLKLVFTSGHLLLGWLRNVAQLKYEVQYQSFEVTTFCTNGKPVCHFLLVNNTNRHPISHRFQVIVQYWSNFRFRLGILVINTVFVSNS